MSDLRRVLALASLATFGLGGCFATPLPDPPDLDPPDVERMHASPVTTLVTSVFAIEGDAGSVAPGVLVHVVPLDTARAPVLTAAAEDGSFRVELPADPGDRLRITFRTEAARSAPLDVIVPTMEGPFEPVTRNPCVRVDPELDLGEVEAGSTGAFDLVLDNTCGAAIRIETRMRAPSTVISIGAPSSQELAPGESAVLTVTFAPPVAGAYEEVAFVDVGGPFAERYPLSLFGAAR